LHVGSALLLARDEGFVPRRKSSKRDLPRHGGRAFSVKRYSVYVLFICGASGFDGGDRSAKRHRRQSRRKGVLIAESERRDRSSSSDRAQFINSHETGERRATGQEFTGRGDRRVSRRASRSPTRNSGKPLTSGKAVRQLTEELPEAL